MEKELPKIHELFDHNQAHMMKYIERHTNIKCEYVSSRRNVLSNLNAVLEQYLHADYSPNMLMQNK